MPDEPIIRLNGNNTPAVHGTRLTVYAIMDNYFGGETAEMIAEFYRIGLKEAEAAIDYINSHMTDLMPNYQQMRARERQGNPPHVQALLATAHQNMMRLRAEFDRRRSEGNDARIAG